MRFFHAIFLSGWSEPHAHLGRGSLHPRDRFDIRLGSIIGPLGGSSCLFRQLEIESQVFGAELFDDGAGLGFLFRNLLGDFLFVLLLGTLFFALRTANPLFPLEAGGDASRQVVKVVVSGGARGRGVLIFVQGHFISGAISLRAKSFFGAVTSNHFVFSKVFSTFGLLPLQETFKLGLLGTSFENAQSSFGLGIQVGVFFNPGLNTLKGPFVEGFGEALFGHFFKATMFAFPALFTFDGLMPHPFPPAMKSQRSTLLSPLLSVRFNGRNLFAGPATLRALFKSFMNNDLMLVSIVFSFDAIDEGGFFVRNAFVPRIHDTGLLFMQDLVFFGSDELHHLQNVGKDLLFNFSKGVMVSTFSYFFFGEGSRFVGPVV